MKMSLTTIPLVSKLAKNVIRILGCNPGPMTLQGTNTYLVGTGKRRILIDSGDKDTASAYIKLLGNVLRDESTSVEHLILTHWHHDHVGGVDSIKDLINSRDGSSISVWKLRRPEAEESLENCYFLKDEQSLDVEGARLQIKYTPGHTTDHACVLLVDENILFSGDCILGEGTAVFEDLKDYMKSLENILEMKPKIIYPGHGPVIEDPVPKIKFYIEHRMKRENEILEALKSAEEKGFSEMNIVESVYRNTPKNLWPAAAINVGHHLEKLQKDGKVENKDGRWFLSRL